MTTCVLSFDFCCISNAYLISVAGVLWLLWPKTKCEWTGTTQNLAPLNLNTRWKSIGVINKKKRGYRYDRTINVVPNTLPRGSKRSLLKCTLTHNTHTHTYSHLCLSDPYLSLSLFSYFLDHHNALTHRRHRFRFPNVTYSNKITAHTYTLA